MRRLRLGVVTVLLLLLSMSISMEVSALPKAYKILFVNDGVFGGEQGPLYNRIWEYYEDSGLDSDNIDVWSAGVIENFSKETLAKYDVVVWGYQGGMLSTTVVERILSLDIPVIVFDDNNFTISKQLRVIDQNVTEQDLSAGTDDLLVDRQHNGQYHPLMAEMMSNCFMFFRTANIDRNGDGFNDIECAEFPEECYDAWPDDGVTNFYYYSISENRLNRYTRPLLVDRDDETKAVVFVNDKKRVIVFGTYQLPVNGLWKTAFCNQTTPAGSTHPCYIPDNKGKGDLLYRFIKQSTASDTNLNSIGDWIKPEGADQEMLFSPSGDNVVSEVDLVVPSRGFDFTINRTYRSGANEPYSILGPSWHLNLDRSLVWNRFDDTVMVTDPTGGAQLFELVQGADSLHDIDGQERRTFVSTNGVTDIVTYYPPGNGASVTRGNRSNETCSFMPETQPSADALNKEGFLVRDKAGNKAFFAPHNFEYEWKDIWCQGSNTGTDYEDRAPMLWGRHDFRTRGGEAKIFKIAYVEDANGNRQNFYYKKAPTQYEPTDHGNNPGDYVPEEHLSCVVDTEGRGYVFNVQWMWDTMHDDHVSYYVGPTDPNPAGVAGKTNHVFPWLRSIDIDGDIETGGYILYDIWKPGEVLNSDYNIKYADNGLTLGGVNINNDIRRFYDYHDSCYINEYAAPRVPRVLSQISKCKNYDGSTCAEFTPIWSYDYFTTEVPERFVGTCDNEAYPYAFDEFEYEVRKAKLKKITAHDVDGNPSSTTFFRYTKEQQDIPTRDQLKKKYGWVSINKNGVVDNLVYNRRYHLIEHKRNYRVRPSAWQDSEIPVCLENDPMDCDGWSWKYETNYDGKVTLSESPSGIKTYREHGYDTVLAFSSFSRWDWESMDDWLARFWKSWWYLRYYLDNEVMTTRQKGAKWEATATNYEPVYNQPLSVSNLWIEYDVITFGSGIFSFQVTVPTLKWQADKWYRYDYMESGGDQSASTRLAQMNIPQALLNPMGFWSVWLSGLPFNECTDAAASPGSLPSWNTNAGNLVCEIKPQTTGEGYSNGRAKAYAYFDCDSSGRQTYTKDFSGRVTTQAYGCLDGPTALDFGSTCGGGSEPPYSAMRVSRYGLDAEMQGESIDTWYEYDKRGFNTRKVLYTDLDNSTAVVTRFVRNTLGWITDMSVASENGIEAHEIYTHDDMGNVIRVETDRLCGSTSCEYANMAGDTLTRILGYDNQNRKLWECKETLEATLSGAFFTCEEYEYDADGLWARKAVHEQCSGDTASSEMPYCDENATLMYAVENTYDGRRLPYRGRRVNREGDARIYRRYYNPDGQLAALRDPDSNGDGEGEWSYYAYGPLGRLWRKYEGGFGTEYEFDGIGNLVRESRGSMPGAEVGGSSVDIATFSLGESLGESLYTHDERRVIIARNDLQHDIGQNASTGERHWTYYVYDQDDRVSAEVRDYTGQTVNTMTEYDTYGRVETMTDGRSGVWTGYDRDNMGRVLQEEVVWLGTDGSTSHELYKSYAYNAADQVVAASISGTDSEDCLMSEISTDDCHVTLSNYDGFGQLDNFVDARGQVTGNVRDGQGNVLAMYEEDAAGVDDIQIAASYDGLGNVLERIDALGNATTYTRNGFGELTSILHPDGEYEKVFALNNEGAIQGIQHIYGGESLADITMDLDKYNRPLDVRVNGELAQSYTYDAMGNMGWSVDYNLGLRSVMSHSDRAVVVNRTWDTFGNLVSDEVNGKASTADFERNRLASLTSPAGIATNITYDHYSALGYRGLPSRVTADDGAGGASDLVVNYEWLGPRLTKNRRTLGNGSDILSTSQTFNGFGNVAARTEDLSTGSVLSDFTYTYNRNERLELETAGTSEGDFNDIEYALDYLDRVEGFDNQDVELEYTLDKANNIEHVNMDTGSGFKDVGMGISEDGMNKLESISVHEGVQIGYAYDKRGNLISRIEVDGEIWKARATIFDRLGRLFSAYNAEDGSNTLKAAFYKYDALGRRTGKVLMQAPLDPQQPLTEPTPQVLSLNVPPQIYDDILNLVPNLLNTAEVTETVTFNLYGDDVLEEIHEYTDPGIDDMLIAIHHDATVIDRYNRWDIYENDGSGWVQSTSFTPITDVRNNVAGLVNETGDLFFKIVYDIHGNAAYCDFSNSNWYCSLDPGNLDLSPSLLQAIPYRFSGRRYDPETELYYYRSRYYSPEMGRFISLDTIGIWGDLNNYGNGYAYVGNMGNAFVDPEGKGWWIVVAAAVVVAAYYGIPAIITMTSTSADAAEKGGKGADIMSKYQEEVEPQINRTNQQLKEAHAKPVSKKEKIERLKNALAEIESQIEEAEALGDVDRLAHLQKMKRDRQKKLRNLTGSGNGMTLSDNEGPSPDQLKEMLESGRLTPKNLKKRFSEYNWENAQRNLKKLLLEASKKKKKILGSDDGKIHLNEPLRDPNPIDYTNRMKIHNPGCVDPILTL